MNINAGSRVLTVAVALTGMFTAISGWTAPSYINGLISFTGTPILNGAISSATEITSYSNVTAIGNTNGSYAPLNGRVAAVWMPFTFDPPTVPIAPLWSCDSNGVTYSFDATSMMVVFSTSNFLNIEGAGIAHITGYADTPGIWTIGIGQVGASMSFSASTMVSPTNLPMIQYSPVTNGYFQMNWNALPGQPYQLQTTPSTTPFAWTNTGPVITTTNATADASYSGATDPQRLFRVMLLP